MNEGVFTASSKFLKENKKLYMKNERQNNSNKEISIPLFIPLLIIIISIIVFVNISNSNSTVIATSNQEVAETNLQNELETEETAEIVETEEEILYTPENEVEEEITEPTISNETQSTTPKTATYTVDSEQYTVVGVLDIPSLNIKYPILSETTTKLLKVSLTKYWGANPNEVGNMVVVGHNYKNNKFFGNLSKIQHGEIVKITDLAGKTLDYKVYDTYVVDQYDNTCTSQLTDGKTEITLITCHYENASNHATKRFVVKARAD